MATSAELEAIRRALSFLTMDGLPPYLPKPLWSSMPAVRQHAIEEPQATEGLSRIFLDAELKKITGVGPATADKYVAAVFGPKPTLPPERGGGKRARSAVQAQASSYESVNLEVKPVSEHGTALGLLATGAAFSAAVQLRSCKVPSPPSPPMVAHTHAPFGLPVAPHRVWTRSSCVSWMHS